MKIAPVRRLMLLMGAYYFIQCLGGNPGIHAQALTKHLKDGLGMDAAGASGFTAMLILPWTIKPLYGLLSDFVPILGSRRKSYLILAALLALSGFIAVALLGASLGTLKAGLLTAAVGLAFTDVLCDAVMVERGQPLGATDKLQSAQWAALGLGLILVSATKGWLAEHMPLEKVLWISAAFPAISLLVTAFALKEAKPVSAPEEARLSWASLKEAARMRTLWASALFIFLYECSPTLGPNLYFQQKNVLGFTDLQIGQIDTAGSVAFLLGALAFGALSSRLSHRGLLHLTIGAGVGSMLLYLGYSDLKSAYVITALYQLSRTVALLGILTVAARICPRHVEGTVFALLVSVANLGITTGVWAGGRLYGPLGFRGLVLVSAGMTAAMWLFLPLARASSGRPGTPASGPARS